jgi:MarC family membrane protein
MNNLFALIIIIFFVLNPLGNIPVYITTLKHVSAKRRSKIIIREAIFALIILCIFLFAGHNILKTMQISESALGIAGGILLFIIAIRLIFPTYSKQEEEAKTVSEPFLVPLAIPLFAGPGAMTTVMLLSHQHPHNTLAVFIALLIAWLISSAILLASSKISNILGARGLAAIERLMGMILTAIAIQMLLSGIQTYFHIAA